MNDRSRRLWLAGTVGAGATLLASRAAKAQGVTPTCVPLGTTSTAALPGNFGAVDDPTNASGLSAPAVIRGTVYAHLCAGVTVGSGGSTGVRTNTLNGLIAGMTWAANNNHFFVMVPGTYEIFGALQIPLINNLVVEGSLGVNIVQYQTNVPIVVIGDPAGNVPPFGQRIRGMNLSYGVSQTGNTGAFALQLGAAFFCIYEQITTGSYSVNPPYIGLNISCANGSNHFFFQNVIRDIYINGGQQNLVNWEISSTGNLVSNLYTVNGSSVGTATATGGPAWFFSNSQSMSDDVFERCNIEHVQANNLIKVGQNSGPLITATFIGMHIEGVVLTGSFATAIAVIGGIIRFINTYCLDINLDAGASGCMFYQPSGFGERVDFAGLVFDWFTANAIGKTFTLFSANGNNGNDVLPATLVKGLLINDGAGGNTANIVLSPNMSVPITSGFFVTEYSFDNLLPFTSQIELNITASYTHYGQHAAAVLFVPAALAGSTTISLSAKFKASGTGSTLATPTSSRVRIRRQSGSVANNLLIVDVASSSTLATNSTAGIDLEAFFNGTNWVLFT